MVEPQRDRQDLAGGPLQDLRCRPAVLGWVLHESVREDLLEISFPGAFLGQALDALNQNLRRLACKIEHEFGRHPETVVCFIASARTRLRIALLRDVRCSP